MTTTMTTPITEEYPMLEGVALDQFLGRIRNKEGRIVKYTRVKFAKRNAKKIIADMQYTIGCFKLEIATSKSRMRKAQLYARIEGRLRCIKDAEKLLTK